MIEQTIRQKLPDGLPDRRVPARARHARPGRAAREPAAHDPQAARAARAGRGGARRGDAAGERLPETEGVDAGDRSRARCPARDPWEIVQLARHIDRPHTLDYVGFVFDDFQELHGDRLFDEDAAIVGGLARLGDLTVMVIGHQKGHTTSEMMERNFGMPEPEGYRKGCG